MRFDPKDFCQSIHHKDGDLSYYSLPALAKKAGSDLNRLPYSIRVLLESATDTYLFETIRRAFIRRFVTADGLLIGQTQTACALAR